MQKIPNFKIEDVPHHTILFAATEENDYDGDRTLIAEAWPEYGDYTVISGGHCSCYSFDGVEWEAIRYTRDELLKVALGWHDSYGSESIVKPLILEYLGQGDA